MVWLTDLIPFCPIIVNWQVHDNQWHQTILEFNTTVKEALPVIDAAPYDVAGRGTDLKQDFIIELGPVCFLY